MLKKSISVILALVMILSLFAFTPVTGSSAENEAEGSNTVGTQTHTQPDIINFVKDTYPELTTNEKYEVMPSKTYQYRPGKLTEDAKKYALYYANVVRYVAGLDTLELNDEYGELAQAAALITCVNGYLSHYPSRPNHMEDDLYNLCYRGASRSNLAGGYPNLSSAIVGGWMYDSDNYNLAQLGHRRWILYPELKYTGFGDVYNYQAMYVSPDYYSQTSEINNVAWPARQMPEALFSDDSAWSLSTGKIESLDKIEVELEDIYGGKVWKFSSSTDPEADDSGYFNVDNTSSGLTGCIIFRPNNINIAEESKYQVTIKGTVSGTITYTVNFFSLNKKFPTELKMFTSSISLYPGKQYELTAYGEPQNTDRTIEWSSSDPSIATVSPSGVVTAVSEGQATITASTLNGLTATCVVTVLPILKGTTGDCVWTLIDKELTISGKGAMADYTDGEYNYKETPWGRDVRTLIIEDGVEHIGGGAFLNNDGLHNVVLPDSVTSIGDRAFDNSYYLESITIPDSVTSIGENAFRRTKLTNIELSRSVAHIGIGAFASCVNIESLSVDEANPVYDSRDNCNAIIETATNTLIAGCKNTVIPDSVTRIDDQAFKGCRDLTEINIPDSVTSIGSYAFAYSNLSQIRIPDSVTSIGSNAFAGCSNLSQIRIPDSVTSIGRYAFYDTAYYNAHPDGVVYIDKAACGFKGPVPESVIVKDGTLVLEDSLFSQRAVKSVTLPDSLRYLGKYTFSWASYLSDLTLSNSITSIESQTFFFCRSLKKLTIPDSVKRIEDRAFELSTGIESINIPNSVTYIGDKAFHSCYMLNSISIPSSVEYIGTEAFSSCYMLNSISIPSSVEYIGTEVFSGCHRLTSISVDKDNKHYDSRNNCNAIIETATNTLIAGCMDTVIPDTVVAIGDDAMSGRYIYEMVIPESVTTIGNNAFRSNDFSEIIIPDSVTSIGDMAFYNCYNLKSITIPASVTHIGDRAFGYIYTDESVLLDGFTISGYKGTAAEEYAKANGIEFISLDKPICGDTDNDGTVTILDATFIQRYLIKLAIPFEMNIEVADTDGDGEITITDATFIQRYLNSIEIPYEIGKPIKT